MRKIHAKICFAGHLVCTWWLHFAIRTTDSMIGHTCTLFYDPLAPHSAFLIAHRGVRRRRRMGGRRGYRRPPRHACPRVQHWGDRFRSRVGRLTPSRRSSARRACTSDAAPNGHPVTVIDAATQHDRWRPPLAESKLRGGPHTYWSRSPTQDDIHEAPGTQRSSGSCSSASRREVLGVGLMLGVRSTRVRARELSPAVRRPQP